MRVLNDFGPSRLGVRRNLGYAQGSPEEAALAFSLSARAFEGVSNWGISDADWNGTASELARRTAIEVGNLERNVLGKLGAPEAEEAAQKLYGDWKDQLAFAQDALKNPPGWWDQTRAKVVQFVSDFRAGAVAAWGEYSDYALASAGPVLKSYWDSVSKVNSLKKDLDAAKASGDFPKEVTEAQAAKVAEAEAKINSVRNLYRNVSGGSIDDIAQREHGQYGLSGLQALALPPTLVVGIVAVAFTVYLLSSNVDALKPLFSIPKTVWDYATDPKNKSTVVLVAAVVLAIFIIPPILKD